MLTIVCVVLEFSFLRSWKVPGKVQEFCSVISVATLSFIVSILYIPRSISLLAFHEINLVAAVGIQKHWSILSILSLKWHFITLNLGFEILVMYGLALC